MRTRSEIKKDAKSKLNAYWHVPVLTVLIVYLLEALILGALNDSMLSSVFQIIITTIASVFTTMLFLNIAKNDEFEKVEFSWMKVSSMQLLKCIVYTLLLSLATAMIQYITVLSSVLLSAIASIFVLVVEVYLSFSLLIILDTDAPIIDAAKQSINLVEGNFWKIIVFGLSFVGWFILGIIPVCLGLLWVLPYMGISFANYYLELKSNKPII
ncbi:DUF975 family protein [Intestinibacter sp.]|uniref:DUF975 family protein n=1 Tax=Intestinibacter sp. TaxID=1965304 RepID=UPI002A91C4CF|nr:DUF975 family protein [Intestinibacter sp.]MDY5212636.1 DUF975 family protein [Intestinibacter sp.]